MYKYIAYGLTLQSDLELPELTPDNFTKADLTVRSGAVSNDLPGSRDDAFRCRVVADGAYLSWREIGNFFVARSGDTIVYGGLPDVDPDYIRLAVLGPLLALVQHYLGRLVLHAGASVVRGRACLFLGPSHSGKSTMVAAMHRCGHRLLCDDVTALDFNMPGTDLGTAFPGIPRLKLWPDSAVSASLSKVPGKPLYDGYDKLSVFPDQIAFNPRCNIPVDTVFFLKIAKTLGASQLSRQEALIALLANGYVAVLDRRLDEDTRGRQLVQCGRMVQTTNAFVLERPPDLDALPDVVRLVEECIAGCHNDSMATGTRTNTQK